MCNVDASKCVVGLDLLIGGHDDDRPTAAGPAAPRAVAVKCSSRVLCTMAGRGNCTAECCRRHSCSCSQRLLTWRVREYGSGAPQLHVDPVLVGRLLVEDVVGLRHQTRLRHLRRDATSGESLPFAAFVRWEAVSDDRFNVELYNAVKHRTVTAQRSAAGYCCTSVQGIVCRTYAVCIRNSVQAHRPLVGGEQQDVGAGGVHLVRLARVDGLLLHRLDLKRVQLLQLCNPTEETQTGRNEDENRIRAIRKAETEVKLGRNGSQA